MSNSKHPMQPIVFDDHGVARFKENKIVDFLASNRLNELAVMNFPERRLEPTGATYRVFGFWIWRSLLCVDDDGEEIVPEAAKTALEKIEKWAASLGEENNWAGSEVDLLRSF